MVEQRRDQARHRLPGLLGGPGAVPRRVEGGERRPQAPPGRPPRQPGQDLLQPQPARARRLLRALHLPLRRPVQRPRRQAPADGPPHLAHRRQAHGDQVGPELGRRSLRLPHLRRAGSQPGRALRRGAGRAAGDRADGLLLPAAHLQPLPQPGLRGRLRLGGHLQAGRGRHRPRQPGPLPRLAHVRQRLPVQEDLLQLVHREVGEVHPLLPAARGRRGAGLLPHLRGAHPLPGGAALRRRPAATRRPGSDAELVAAQREVILDPNDPAVVEAARQNGVPDAVIDSARRSPVYRFVKEWGIALPLHPEYRTLPMLFYVPPLLPAMAAGRRHRRVQLLHLAGEGPAAAQVPGQPVHGRERGAGEGHLPQADGGAAAPALDAGGRPPGRHRRRAMAEAGALRGRRRRHLPAHLAGRDGPSGSSSRP